MGAFLVVIMTAGGVLGTVDAPPGKGAFAQRRQPRDTHAERKPVRNYLRIRIGSGVLHRCTALTATESSRSRATAGSEEVGVLRDSEVRGRLIWGWEGAASPRPHTCQQSAGVKILWRTPPWSPKQRADMLEHTLSYSSQSFSPIFYR